MKVDLRNNMVGEADHIRDVGPHLHDWLAKAREGLLTYDECSVCGARRVNLPTLDWPNARRAAWLLGGGWDDDAPSPEERVSRVESAPMPATEDAKVSGETANPGKVVDHQREQPASTTKAAIDATKEAQAKAGDAPRPPSRAGR